MNYKYCICCILVIFFGLKYLKINIKPEYLFLGLIVYLVWKERRVETFDATTDENKALLEKLNFEAIAGLASVLNKGHLVVDNLTVTGKATIGNTSIEKQGPDDAMIKNKHTTYSLLMRKNGTTAINSRTGPVYVRSNGLDASGILNTGEIRASGNLTVDGTATIGNIKIEKQGPDDAIIKQKDLPSNNGYALKIYKNSGTTAINSQQGPVIVRTGAAGNKGTLQMGKIIITDGGQITKTPTIRRLLFTNIDKADNMDWGNSLVNKDLPVNSWSIAPHDNHAIYLYWVGQDHNNGTPLNRRVALAKYLRYDQTTKPGGHQRRDGLNPITT